MEQQWDWTIGQIVAPFSRFGEVKVRPETDFPERFTYLRTVCLQGTEGDGRLYEVENARFHKSHVLLKLKGIDSIDDAERLRNTFVRIRRQEALRLARNEFYIHDLIGCQVVTLQGRTLGSLTAVLRSGANDVYVIGEGKEEILLPAVSDVVRAVDLDLRRITVTPTPGLLPSDAD